jgi:hypothetical protein
MPDQLGRFEWVKKLNVVALAITLLALAFALVVSISKLVIGLRGGAAPWEMSTPMILILFELAGVVWALIIFGLVRVLVWAESGLSTVSGQMSRLESLLEDQMTSTRRLIDLATLSDQAKSLLYRDKELEAVRELTHGMLVRQDYRAAESLIDSLAERPTYAEEAAAMREELVSTRQATIEGKLELALQRIEEIMGRADWARAMREAQRVRAAFPDNPKIAALPQRIDTARMKHKRDLLQAYGEAVRKNDIDGSIDLLKELDRYLTPQEAAALQDSARGVFKAKLHNLGVQFAIRVTEKQWNEAIAVGEGIIRDYPNSRMAHEVRAKLDQLRQRASDPGETPK